MKHNFVQSHVVKDEAARLAWIMDGDHGNRCGVCHVPLERSGWRGLTVHHIIHGANGRDDEPCNFLLVCGRCHDMIHDGQYRDEETGELLPPITLGMVLWVKSHTESWDDQVEQRLTQLYHKRLPDWEILADYYLAERVRWRGLARAG